MSARTVGDLEAADFNEYRDAQGRYTDRYNDRPNSHPSLSVDHLPEVAAFKAALTQASDDPAAHDQAVQESACAMVRTLHKAHWPIEAIIVLAKRTIADSGASPREHRAFGDPVTEKIVKWCIEHYYAPKD